MAKELTTLEKDFEVDFMPIIMVMMVIAVMDMVITIAPMATQAQQYYAAQAYHGVEDTRTLAATPTLQWINLIHDYPFSYWISAYFINDGPNAVEIGLNYPDKMFTINPNETITVNRSGALDEKISIVYYKCSPGAKTSIRVTGTF